MATGGPGLLGIDLSHWQASTPDLAGRAFVIARATYGTTPDTRFAQHAAATLAAGAVLGAYHFGVSGSTPEAQVGAFLAAVDGRTRWLMLDLEAERGKVPMTTTAARSFIAMIQARGYRCGLYHSASGYPDLGQDWRAVAAWGADPPTIPWDVWQYGTDPELHVDGDRFAGDLAALRRLAELEGSDMIYTRGGLETATVPAGTAYHHEPNASAPGGTIHDATRYFLTAWTADASWVALDGLYDQSAGAPVACGWVPASVLVDRRPLVTGAARPAGLAVKLTDGTYVDVPA